MSAIVWPTVTLRNRNLSHGHKLNTCVRKVNKRLPPKTLRNVHLRLLYVQWQQVVSYLAISQARVLGPYKMTHTAHSSCSDASPTLCRIPLLTEGLLRRGGKKKRRLFWGNSKTTTSSLRKTLMGETRQGWKFHATTSGGKQVTWNRLIHRE